MEDKTCSLIVGNATTCPEMSNQIAVTAVTITMHSVALYRILNITTTVPYEEVESLDLQGYNHSG